MGTVLSGTKPIEITRDRGGVQHVGAASKIDALKGLGYCHAKDRGLQMLMLRTLIQGRGCEQLAASEEMLAIDSFFRKMNFTHGVDAELGKLSSEERSLLDSYVDGVNAALVRPPWELRLLGFDFTPWTARDTVALPRMINYVAMAQAQGDFERFIVQMIQAGVGQDALEEMFPGKLGGLDIDLVRKVKLGEPIVPDAVRWHVPSFMASNNWVISGDRTSSGKPILASDPHLDITMVPNPWHESALSYPGFYSMGFGMAGLPAHIIGRSPELIWGVTYSFLDAVDSWIEECRDGKYRRVIDGKEQWVDFEVRRETIKRKKQEPVELTFYENEHGVLAGDPNRDGYYLATKWAGAKDTGALSLSSFLEFMGVSSAERGRELLGQLETSWSWVFADSKNNIAFQMSGLSPIRREGVSGLIPLAGWEPANDWRGFRNVEELPRSLNPEEGFIATANHDLNYLATCEPINAAMGASRVERIRERIAGSDDWSVDGVRRLQTELYSKHAEPYLEILKPLMTERSDADDLANWDLNYNTESKGAYVFERFYANLLESVFGAALGDDIAHYLSNHSPLIADFYDCFDRILLQEESTWFGSKSRMEHVSDALNEALGGEIKSWGQDRQLILKHMLLGDQLPNWMGFNLGPFCLAGGRGTIQQGQVYKNGDKVATFAPCLRFVSDLNEHGAHTTAAGGPSDRRFSKWYASDLGYWLSGKLKTVAPQEGGLYEWRNASSVLIKEQLAQEPV